MREELSSNQVRVRMADSDTAAKDIDEGNQVCKRPGAGANSSALMANGCPCFWNILNPRRFSFSSLLGGYPSPLPFDP